MPRRHVLEKTVKRMIRSYLDVQVGKGVCYYRMPVLYGFGKKSIDFEGCIHGYFFGIEAKSPDNDADLTTLQRDTCLSIIEAGGKAFIISTEDGLNALKRWVDRCSKA